MPVVSLKCSHCNGDVQLDDSKEFGFCVHCGTKIMIQQEIRHVHIKNDMSRQIQADLNFARAHFAQGDYEQAGDYAEDVLLLDEAQPDAWMIIGYAQWLHDITPEIFLADTVPVHADYYSGEYKILTGNPIDFSVCRDIYLKERRSDLVTYLATNIFKKTRSETDDDPSTRASEWDDVEKYGLKEDVEAQIVKLEEERAERLRMIEENRKKEELRRQQEEERMKMPENIYSRVFKTSKYCPDFSVGSRSTEDVSDADLRREFDDLYNRARKLKRKDLGLSEFSSVYTTEMARVVEPILSCAQKLIVRDVRNIDILQLFKKDDAPLNGLLEAVIPCTLSVDEGFFRAYTGTSTDEEFFLSRAADGLYIPPLVILDRLQRLIPDLLSRDRIDECVRILFNQMEIRYNKKTNTLKKHSKHTHHIYCGWTGTPFDFLFGFADLKPLIDSVVRVMKNDGYDPADIELIDYSFEYCLSLKGPRTGKRLSSYPEILVPGMLKPKLVPVNQLFK